MPSCPSCHNHFARDGNLTRHLKTCPAVAQTSKEIIRNAKRSLASEGPSGKKPRLKHDVSRIHFLLALHCTHTFQTTLQASGSQGQLQLPLADMPYASHAVVSQVMFWPAAYLLEQQIPYHADVAFTVEPHDAPQSTVTRSGRSVRLPWKVRDQLPEAPGIIVEEPDIPQTASDQNATYLPDPPPRRVRLLVTERIRTAANRFGLSRLYKRRPVRDPDPFIDLTTVYTPTAAERTQSRPQRLIKDIIAPYPNLSSFLFNRHHWNTSKKSIADREALRAVVTDPRFDSKEIEGVNFQKLDTQLASAEVPLVFSGEGWKCSSITIGIPRGQKTTQRSLNERNADARRVERGEGLLNTPAESPILGVPVSIPGLHHKSICAEIRNTYTHHEEVKRFDFDPYELYYTPPGFTGTPERVFSELINSDAAVREDLRLQNSPREPGCNLPRAVVPVLFWSDATHVAQFGKSKVWPVYMSYGNQSKYERMRPSSKAIHHIAYFPSVSRCSTTLSYSRVMTSPHSFPTRCKIAFVPCMARGVRPHCLPISNGSCFRRHGVYFLMMNLSKLTTMEWWLNASMGFCVDYIPVYSPIQLITRRSMVTIAVSIEAADLRPLQNAHSHTSR